MSNRVAQKKVPRDDMGEYMYEEVEAPLPGTSAYKMMKHRASFASATTKKENTVISAPSANDQQQMTHQCATCNIVFPINQCPNWDPNPGKSCCDEECEFCPNCKQ